MKQELLFGTHVILLERKKMKTLRLRFLYKKAEFRLSVPIKTKESEIFSFLEKHKDWMDNNLNLYPLEKIKTFQWQNGDELYFLGEKYIYHEYISEQFDRELKIEGHQIKYYQNRPLTRLEKRRELYAFYYKSYTNILTTIIDKWTPRINLKPNSIEIKHLKSKWGSCRPKTGHFVMNIRLMYYPIECIELVYVHECVHLWEPSHNARFQKLLTDLIPQRKKWEKELKELRVDIFQ